MSDSDDDESEKFFDCPQGSKIINRPNGNVPVFQLRIFLRVLHGLRPALTVLHPARTTLRPARFT